MYEMLQQDQERLPQTVHRIKMLIQMPDGVLRQFQLRLQLDPHMLKITLGAIQKPSK